MGWSPNRWLAVVSKTTCNDEDRKTVLEACLGAVGDMLSTTEALIDGKRWKSCLDVLNKSFVVSRKETIVEYEKFLQDTMGTLISTVKTPKWINNLFSQMLHRTWWTQEVADMQKALEILHVSEWFKHDAVVVLKVLNDLFTITPLPSCQSKNTVAQLIEYAQLCFSSIDLIAQQQAGLLLPKLLQLTSTLQPDWDRILLTDCTVKDLNLVYGMASTNSILVSKKQAAILCQWASPYCSQTSQAVALDSIHCLFRHGNFPTQLKSLLFDIIGTQSTIETSLAWKRNRLLEDYMSVCSAEEQAELLGELLKRASSNRQWIGLLLTCISLSSEATLEPMAMDIWNAIKPRFSLSSASRKAAHVIKTLTDRLPGRLDICILNVWLPSLQENRHLLDLIIHLHCALPPAIALECLTTHDTELFLRINDRIKKSSDSLMVADVARSMVAIGTFELLHELPPSQMLEWMETVMLANCKTQTPEIRVKILADVKKLVHRLKARPRKHVVQGLTQYAVVQLWEGASPLRHFFHIMLLQLLVELSSDIHFPEDMWRGLKTCMGSSFANVRSATRDLIKMIPDLSIPSTQIDSLQREAMQCMELQSLTKTEFAGILTLACPNGMMRRIWDGLLGRFSRWKRTGVSDGLTNVPIHGALFSISLLLPNNIIPDETILEMCVDLIGSVLTFVANDAPEGFVDEDSNDDLSQKSQILLHSAYLTVKHACSIICTLRTQNDEVGRQLLDWTLQVKHKGVIKPMCEATTSLLKTFPASSLKLLMDKTTVYRRSAGLAGLVTTFKAQPETIGRLIELTKSPELSYRVHALNCLRAITRDGKSHLALSIHLSAVCQVAIDAFRHSEYSENNAGLMLFVAVTERLDKFNWMGFCRTFSDLTSSLLRTLEHSIHHDDAIGLPILVLFRRLLSNQVEMKEEDELTSILFRACSCRIYQVRQLATSCLAILLSNQGLGESLLDMALDCGGFLQHGLLGVCLVLSKSEQVILNRHVSKMWALFDACSGWSIKTRLIELFATLQENVCFKRIAQDASQPSLVRQSALDLVDSVIEFVSDKDPQVRQKALELLLKRSTWEDTSIISSRIHIERHPRCIALLFRIASLPEFPHRSTIVPIAQETLVSVRNPAIICACIPLVPTLDAQLAQHQDPSIRQAMVSHASLNNDQAWIILLQDGLEEIRIRASKRLHPTGIPPTPEVALEKLLHRIGKDNIPLACYVPTKDTLFAPEVSEIIEPLHVYFP
jgi:hypothetical protein